MSAVTDDEVLLAIMGVLPVEMLDALAPAKNLDDGIQLLAKHLAKRRAKERKSRMSTVTDLDVLAKLTVMIVDPVAKAAIANVSTLAEALILLSPIYGDRSQAWEHIDHARRDTLREACDMKSI